MNVTWNKKKTWVTYKWHKQKSSYSVAVYRGQICCETTSANTKGS
jgi:hypothetical protein